MCLCAATGNETFAKLLFTCLHELFDPSVGLLTKSQKLSACGAPPPADQTVRDLPTKVGRSLRPDGYPKKFMMVVQRSYSKLSAMQ
jgi:hypothetical protein